MITIILFIIMMILLFNFFPTVALIIVIAVAAISILSFLGGLFDSPTVEPTKIDAKQNKTDCYNKLVQDYKANQDKYGRSV
jgi:hypothetical protein